VLDVGCRDGLFALTADEMRPAEVIGIDNDLSRGAVKGVAGYWDACHATHSLHRG
jgi:predicted RNA methylase